MGGYEELTDQEEKLKAKLKEDALGSADRHGELAGRGAEVNDLRAFLEVAIDQLDYAGLVNLNICVAHHRRAWDDPALRVENNR